MDYDKNSFLAGLSVGRTLKGWAGGGAGSGSGGGGGLAMPQIVRSFRLADDVRAPWARAGAMPSTVTLLELAESLTVSGAVLGRMPLAAADFEEVT